MAFDIFKSNQIKAENEILKQKITLLEKQLNELQGKANKIDFYIQQNSSLSAELKNLKRLNDSLRTEIETLKEENRILANKNVETTKTIKQNVSSVKTLSYKNARMLEYWDGRDVKSIPSSYELENYGSNLLAMSKTFLKDGLLRISTPRENVDCVGVSELKAALRAVGDKVSGNKNELIQRVLKYDDDVLEKHFQDYYYILTDLGKKQIDDNSIYFYNDTHYCGLTVSELKELKSRYPNYSDTEIFVLTFKSKLIQDVSQEDWTSYEKHLRTLTKILIQEEQYQEALQFLWDSMLYKLSGIGYTYFTSSEIKTNIREYEYLSIDQHTISDIDECINNLEIDVPTFANYIRTNCFAKSPNLPFSYFSKQNVLNIICDKLNGIEFYADTCKYRHNIPDANSKSYKYITLNE